MKTTVNINGNDVEIELTQEQLDKAIEDSRPKKIKLEGGDWYVNYRGDVYKGGSSNGYRSFGLEFRTEELAEQASKEMRRANRLRALARQLEPDWVDGDHSIGYSINRNRKTKEYCVNGNYDTRYLGTVYMSRKTAETICGYLNDGLFDLDKE